MKRLLPLLLGLLLLAPLSARAQSVNVIPTCGTGAPKGISGELYMDQFGNLCTNAGGASGGVAGVTMTNKSGTIAAGGSSQVAIAANPNRVSCSLQPQTTDQYESWSATALLDKTSKYLTVLTEDYCPAGYKGPVSTSGLTTGAAYNAWEGTVP